MAGESRSFKIGNKVIVTAPDALTAKVADQVSAALSEVFGAKKSRARSAISGERLSKERIVAVAIEQMRGHGYDAVTMRSIARELGTGPASLYAHVANRAELDQLVTAQVCAAWEIPDPDPERWDQQLRAAMIDLLEIYRANPGVARCTLGMIPIDPGIMMVTERLLALLTSGGVSAQDAGWFIDVASLYVASVAVEEDIWRERGRHLDAAAVTEEVVVSNVRAVFERLPVEHFPLLHGMAEAMTTGSGDERFAFGVDLLVAGLKARAQHAG
jgi:AcrR family transcriptional regulator